MKGQTVICRRGVHPAPPPFPESPALRPGRGAETGAQNTKEVLPSCRAAEVAVGQTEESRGPHTAPDCTFPSSSSSSVFLARLFVLFVLKSSQSKKGGRAQGVGRLLAAAGALGAGER